jgi:hypothetical protein
MIQDKQVAKTLAENRANETKTYRVLSKYATHEFKYKVRFDEINFDVIPINYPPGHESRVENPESYKLTILLAHDSPAIVRFSMEKFDKDGNKMELNFKSGFWNSDLNAESGPKALFIESLDSLTGDIAEAIVKRKKSNPDIGYFANLLTLVEFINLKMQMKEAVEIVGNDPKLRADPTA